MKHLGALPPPLLFTEPINGADNIADVSRITISQERWREGTYLNTGLMIHKQHLHNFFNRFRPAQLVPVLPSRFLNEHALLTSRNQR